MSLPSTLTTCSTLTLLGGPVSSAKSTAPCTASSPAVNTLAERIEQCFGCVKTEGPLALTTVRGLEKVDQPLTQTMAAYNLTRLRALAVLPPQAAQ